MSSERTDQRSMRALIFERLGRRGCRGRVRARVALRTRAATLRVARIAVLGAILLRGAVCAEERDRGSHVEREAALARCLSAEGASPGSIWTAFLKAAPVFSTSEGADCHFTSFTLV